MCARLWYTELCHNGTQLYIVSPIIVMYMFSVIIAHVYDLHYKHTCVQNGICNIQKFNSVWPGDAR